MFALSLLLIRRDLKERLSENASLKSLNYVTTQDFQAIELRKLKEVKELHVHHTKYTSHTAAYIAHGVCVQLG